MKPPDLVFRLDRHRFPVRAKASLSTRSLGDRPASDCADRPLLGVGISRLQRLPASITRAAIRRSGIEAGGVSRPEDGTADGECVSVISLRCFYVSFWKKKMNGTAALRNRSSSLCALGVIQCALGSAGLQNNKGPLAPRRPQ
jgi:hypothetical protein